MFLGIVFLFFGAMLAISVFHPTDGPPMRWGRRGPPMSIAGKISYALLFTYLGCVALIDSHLLILLPLSIPLLIRVVLVCRRDTRRDKANKGSGDNLDSPR